MWVVSASDPQLPLQIEDAGRRVTEDEEGNFAKVETRTPDWKKIILLEFHSRTAPFPGEPGHPAG